MRSMILQTHLAIDMVGQHRDGARSVDCVAYNTSVAYQTCSDSVQRALID